MFLEIFHFKKFRIKELKSREREIHLKINLKNSIISSYKKKNIYLSNLIIHTNLNANTQAKTYKSVIIKEN